MLMNSYYVREYHYIFVNISFIQNQYYPCDVKSINSSRKSLGELFKEICLYDADFQTRLQKWQICTQGRRSTKIIISLYAAKIIFILKDNYITISYII